jgi:hypothetical protein
MIARNAGRGFLRRHVFKLAVIALVACMVLIAYARASKKPAGAFALAADVPRGALLYAQFNDLPVLVRRWDESKLKEQYLASTNFQQFQSRHLALKLIERWEEFNSAIGFPLDALTVGEAADNRAAIALYDIGRLEMVFVAPIGEDKLAATKFFQNTDQFEETELPDGTVYYSRDVEAEGGRRQQKFAFASSHGRLVLATSEQLLLRTLSNINGKSKNDRLVDEPSFKNLSAEVVPHSLTIWMDQSKLNGDWYFKHYWVMRNVEQLKNMRACVLDLELQEGRWIEHRDFLLTGQTEASGPAIPATVAQRLFSSMPEDAPYFKLRALDEAGRAAALVRDTYVDSLPLKGTSAGGPGWNWRSYEDSDFYPENKTDEWGDGSYYSLDPTFDSLIDDAEDAKVEDEDELAHGRLRQETEQKFVEALRDSIEAAHPLYAATVESPQGINGPLFVEFRRGAVLTLQSPGDFRPRVFESTVANLAESRLMIAGSGTRLSWADGHCEAQEQCRELTLPMLGWGMYYALRGPDLILANSPEMLHALLKGSSATPALDSKSSLGMHDLTVIRLDRREQAFDSLMQKLDAPRVKAYWQERKKEQGEGDGPSEEFFSGNISSLLDVASTVREIRIKRNLQPARLREEVEFIFK